MQDLSPLVQNEKKEQARIAAENLMVNINQKMRIPVGLVIHSCELLLDEEKDANKKVS